MVQPIPPINANPAGTAAGATCPSGGGAAKDAVAPLGAGSASPQAALATSPLPALPPTSGLAGGGAASMFMPMMMQLLQTLVSLVKNFSSGSGSQNSAGAAPASAAPAAKSAPPPASSGGKPNILVIDEFHADNTGFNHGQAMVDTIQQGGPANIQTVNVYDPNGSNVEKNIVNALNQAVTNAKNGNKPDAINLSLEAFGTDDASLQQARQAIDQLAALGVPVEIAAGNNGPKQKNLLADNNAFVVESATNGTVNKDSGVGNIQAEGRTTSFATAGLTAKVAALKASGLTLDQIKQQLGVK